MTLVLIISLVFNVVLVIYATTLTYGIKGKLNNLVDMVESSGIKENK